MILVIKLLNFQSKEVNALKSVVCSFFTLSCVSLCITTYKKYWQHFFKIKIEVLSMPTPKLLFTEILNREN